MAAWVELMDSVALVTVSPIHQQDPETIEITIKA